MPRQPRIILPQSCYHIMARGNNKNIIFNKEKDYNYFLKLISNYKNECPFDLYHYCLMPNHIHFLIQTKKAEDFSRFMKKISLAYFHYFRKEYGWTGHFWQNRFKSQPVGKDSYFMQCGKYIELNPVRANICKNPEDYTYSSYNFYAYGNEDNIITPDFYYQKSGNSLIQKEDSYRRVFINALVKSSYSKKVWGSESQRYSENKKFKRRITALPTKS